MHDQLEIRNRARARKVRSGWAVPLVLLALLTGLLPTMFAPSSATSHPVVVQEPNTNGCNGVRSTPGSENTDKRLIGGTLQPGGTATFEITYPVDPEDATGRTTFVITDCVFINGEAAAKYSVSFVPNTANYVLEFTLVIPADAPLGATYCNYAKTTAAPSTSQASNRKAGPACFIIGGDALVVKVNDLGAPVLGATFEVVCTPTASTPAVLIEGVAQNTYTGTTGTDNSITISGPAGTPCTVTETIAPAGHQRDTQVVNFTIGSGTQQTFTFVNRRLGDLVISKTTTGGTGTFTFEVDCTGTAYDRTVAGGNAIQITNSGTARVGDIPVGTSCTVTELNNPLFTSTVTSGSSPVVIGPGDNTIAFLNVRNTGNLVISKTSVGGTGTFTFEVDCAGTDHDRSVAAGNAIVITTSTSGTAVTASVTGIPTGTACTVTEVADSDYVTVVVPATGTVTIGSGSNTVAFTNTMRGTVEVIKTSLGQPHAGVTFEIRTGASPTSAGTVVATGVTGADGTTNFSGIKLAPGAFQFCETGMPAGWANNLTGFTPGGAVSEGGDNSTECVTFTLDPGETERFTVVNNPPPGGDARTIGYWKNHASCSSSNGRQANTLDATLGSGLLVGDLFVNTCAEALALLTKSSLDGTKRANDAAYALASQLLAAQLNYEAGAGQCAAATTAISQAQALLDNIGFNGSGSYLTRNSPNRNEALRLATLLDRYNNNTLC